TSASTSLAERTRTTTSLATSLTRSSSMRVFVAGGTGHSGSYIIPELIAAGHEVTGLARSDTAAAAVSALGAKVRRGDLEDLEGLMEAAADSDGVIHVAHRQDLLPFGGMDAVSAAELPVMLAHSTTDRAGSPPTLIALAKEKGAAGYPGDGANLWNAVHVRDVASLFRLALEKGPAGRYWD